MRIPVQTTLGISVAPPGDVVCLQQPSSFQRPNFFHHHLLVPFYLSLHSRKTLSLHASCRYKPNIPITFLGCHKKAQLPCPAPHGCCFLSNPSIHTLPCASWALSAVLPSLVAASALSLSTGVSWTLPLPLYPHPRVPWALFDHCKAHVPHGASCSKIESFFSSFDSMEPFKAPLPCTSLVQ